MENSNAVFSIVAKNYLPLAFVLGDSLRQFNPEIKFYILLADTTDDLDFEALPYKVLPLDVLDIPPSALNGMSFKYNVTEFCTAVKPYFFSYLFKQGFKKVIYFDPDICLFDSINDIFDELNKFSIVVTPHFITPELKYTGTITESLLLHVGIFNFGFIAVKNDASGSFFIKWWEERLFSKSFQDKIEAYHTDQKWGDLLPTFFGDKLLISKDIGRNVAIWNFHERTLVYINDVLHVQNRFNQSDQATLKFFHFAGFDIINKSGLVHKNHPEFKLKDFPELQVIYAWYKEALYRNGYKHFISYRYGFDYYDNNQKIMHHHRRFYRRLVEDGHSFPQPFLTKDKNSFFQLLANNNLIGKNKEAFDYNKINEVTLSDFETKLKLMNFGMKILLKLLGPIKYFLFLKFCQRYFRPENQTFLLSQFKRDYYFINENRLLKKQ